MNATRRDALAGLAALAAATGSPGRAAWAADGVSDITLYDGRYAAARAFAAVATRRGHTVFDTADDIGRLWRGPLARPGPLRLSGLGTPADLMLVLDGARARRMTLVYQGHHDGRGLARLVHSLDGATARPRFADDDRCGWATGVAEMLFAPSGGRVRARASTIAFTSRRSADHPGSLVSWMLV